MEKLGSQRRSRPGHKTLDVPYSTSHATVGFDAFEGHSSSKQSVRSRKTGNAGTHNYNFSDDCPSLLLHAEECWHVYHSAPLLIKRTGCKDGSTSGRKLHEQGSKQSVSEVIYQPVKLIRQAVRYEHHCCSTIIIGCSISTSTSYI
jgi:hypothetical protein